ncbi:acetyltransferase [Undibacterium sp.]|uniref:acetyltransferase n=1 Tax=Undibacterium sp. TaxID=1914977 RepID=UPI00351CC8DC
MSKPGLILIGAGGHARSCIDVIEQHGQYQIAGLVGLPEQRHTRQLGYIVIATDDGLDELVRSYPYALITIGQMQSSERRLRLYQQATQCGFQLPVIIAPTAHVSRHASIGAGSIVMHGAIVNAGARVGNNCIINSRALVEHDAKVEDHCHISTGTILNGDVTVGAGSFIGSGCIIKEGVSTGKGCIVGMGCTLRNNIADCYRFIGHDKI